MTPRPPTHREPTDEEMQRLPEGTLVLMNGVWKPTHLADAPIYKYHVYAVPITKQEEAPEPRKTLRDEFAMAALTGELASSSTAESAEATARAAAKAGLEPAQYLAKLCYEIADAMLAARNNQPEKV